MDVILLLLEVSLRKKGKVDVMELKSVMSIRLSCRSDELAA